MGKISLIVAWVVTISLIALHLTACNAIPFLKPTPTPVPTDTSIPPTLTPVLTETPLPTPTNTEVPTETPTITLPPLPTFPPAPTATLSAKEAILVFYINKDEPGPYGCGEALWYVKTNAPKSGNLIQDITFALNTILGYHSDTIGVLYNPGYASALSVSNVVVEQNGRAVVNLSGVYTPTKDRCDGPRFRDQLKQIVKQFIGITSVAIFINGATIGDVISRK